MLCLLALTSPGNRASAQNVTTWHNDINRTGWQQHETVLTSSAISQSNFGLVWQYTGLSGAIYAQPLVYSVSGSVAGCSTNPCIEVIVATERDMLYAFDASSSSNTPLWSVNLAANVGGSWLNCSGSPTPPPTNEICSNGVIYPDMGVTSTPVLDPNTNTLYVVSVVVQGNAINYYLHAVNIVTQADPNPIAISGSVSGYAPMSRCGTGNGTGEITFTPQNHYQRAGLLLLQPPSRNYDGIFVAFSPGGNESYNGWIFSYAASA